MLKKDYQTARERWPDAGFSQGTAMTWLEELSKWRHGAMQGLMAGRYCFIVLGSGSSHKQLTPCYGGRYFPPGGLLK
ncbi:hypothetical protein RRG08_022387 [Elysia crispata]|uniref:Uncharacterized protein n=1 Tax=Elysia crispata TaxID=231223 RepID=A0AAE1D8T2_9GAST|nr:hypothetical protein RRG08_022387 [Elysia crispata]